jgi:hypothetical protein
MCEHKSPERATMLREEVHNLHSSQNNVTAIQLRAYRVVRDETHVGV